MPQVPDASADVLFSGQNIEHLDAGDLVGFLLESRRVLRPGGTIVIDSPNRLVTHPAVWRHPEHVVEFSPEEARSLLTAAGFEVTVLRGYWLCRNPDGELLPLLPEKREPAEYLRRAVLVADRPDEAFCWWLEATPTDRPVDRDELARYVHEQVAVLWDERVNRGGCSSSPRLDSGWAVPEGAVGTVYRTGPIPLFAGQVTVQGIGDGVDALSVRLIADGGAVLTEAPGQLSANVAETRFGVWVDLVAVEGLLAPVLVEGIRVRQPGSGAPAITI